MSLSSDVANYSSITVKSGVDLDSIHPALQSSFQALLAYISQMGYGATVNSAYRTFTQQASVSSTFGTRAIPGQSTHNGVDVGGGYSQALDITIYDPDGNRVSYGTSPATCDQIYYQLGAWWQSLPPIVINGGTFNRRWGGSFSSFDPVHFDFSGRFPTKPIPGMNNVSSGIVVASSTPSNKPVVQVKSEVPQIQEGCKA